MGDQDRAARRRPGPAFAGFLVPAALMLVVVGAYDSDGFAGWGWRGGQYAYAFIGIAVAAVVVGCVLRFLRPPWNSVGTGVVLGGVLGLVVVVGLFVTVLIALSNADWSS